MNGERGELMRETLDNRIIGISAYCSLNRKNISNKKNGGDGDCHTSHEMANLVFQVE
jgi:hypothetical protein